MPDFNYEITYGREQNVPICGVDEVGRGPLAGPVIAAAVIIPPDFPVHLLEQIRDSKKMTETAREKLYLPLTELCSYAVAEASVAEIDQMNILWASMLAMQRAVTALSPAPVLALIDGNRAPQIPCAAHTIIKGDDKSYSIAAASIIAKVRRDRLMKQLAEDYPHYGWEHNAGYGTPQHLSSLTQFGPTPWHRTTFAPVAKIMEKLCLQNEQFRTSGI